MSEYTVTAIENGQWAIDSLSGGRLLFTFTNIGHAVDMCELLNSVRSARRRAGDWR